MDRAHEGIMRMRSVRRRGIGMVRSLSVFITKSIRVSTFGSTWYEQKLSHSSNYIQVYKWPKSKSRNLHSATTFPIKYNSSKD